MSDLIVVTATTDPWRAKSCIESWGDIPLMIVVNGRQWTPDHGVATELVATWINSKQYFGTVPAFRLGMDAALERHPDATVFAALHDDLEIRDPDWATKVLTHFRRHPSCGLAGFGGAVGLGDADLYDKPYNPMSLARIGFRSNLVDAEVHGMRSLLAERVACLDGFSQIGRREFWATVPCGQLAPWNPLYVDPISIGIGPFSDGRHVPALTQLEDLGLRHHIYDGALGCLAKRYGWETWYLPISAKHYGGQTAVGDPGYQAWAQTQIEGGDHGFWTSGHEIVFREFRDILPLRS